MKWSKRKIILLKKLSDEGKSDIEISRIFSNVYDCPCSSGGVEHARRRYNVIKNSDKLNVSGFDVDLLTNKLSSIINKKIFNKPKIQLKSVNGKQVEKAVLVLSDIHTGCVNSIYDKDKGCAVETYNKDIRHKEYNTLKNSIFRISELLKSSYQIDHLIIFYLGDVLTNDRIFKGQIWSIDSPVGVQITDTLNEFTKFVNQLRKIFKKVSVVCLVGNHGRSTEGYQDEPIENNYEHILYKIIKKSYKNIRDVEIIVPDSKSFIYEIYGHKYLLLHGDIIRGKTRNTIEKSIKDIILAYDKDFDVMVFGHFHRADMLSLSERITALINGSFIAKDNYGFRIFKQYSKPQQWLFGVSRKRSITWNYRIDLI
jgi:UDP-2,3-diacylglucosamine pyrophosphatase LpxH